MGELSREGQGKSNKALRLGPGIPIWIPSRWYRELLGGRAPASWCEGDPDPPELASGPIPQPPHPVGRPSNTELTARRNAVVVAQGGQFQAQQFEDSVDNNILGVDDLGNNDVDIDNDSLW